MEARGNPSGPLPHHPACEPQPPRLSRFVAPTLGAPTETGRLGFPGRPVLGFAYECSLR